MAHRWVSDRISIAKPCPMVDTLSKFVYYFKSPKSNVAMYKIS